MAKRFFAKEDGIIPDWKDAASCRPLLTPRRRPKAPPEGNAVNLTMAFQERIAVGEGLAPPRWWDQHRLEYVQKTKVEFGRSKPLPYGRA